MKILVTGGAGFIGGTRIESRFRGRRQTDFKRRICTVDEQVLSGGNVSAQCLPGTAGDGTRPGKNSGKNCRRLVGAVRICRCAESAIGAAGCI